MIRDTETVFGELVVGERFTIGTGVVFEKRGDCFAVVTAGDPEHVGTNFAFGLQKPVRRLQ